MATTTPAERPVDLMIDLRERMVRIETKLDLRADKDSEIDASIVILNTRTAALETEGVVLRTQLKTLRWVGSGALAVIVFLSGFAQRFIG